MGSLEIKIYVEADEIICLMGDEKQEGIEGTGKTVLEALMDFSSKIEAALHQNYYCSEGLVEKIAEMNNAVEVYDHPDKKEVADI